VPLYYCHRRGARLRERVRRAHARVRQDVRARVRQGVVRIRRLLGVDVPRWLARPSHREPVLAFLSGSGDPAVGSPCSPSSPRHLHLRHRGAPWHLPPLAPRGSRGDRMLADEGSGGVARCRSDESSGGVVAGGIRRAVSSTSTSSCRHVGQAPEKRPLLMFFERQAKGVRWLAGAWLKSTYIQPNKLILAPEIHTRSWPLNQTHPIIRSPGTMFLISRIVFKFSIPFSCNIRH
jgi:hypothetical protein